MNERASIIYNLTGQTIEFYPPEWAAGVPSAAATYSVWAGSSSMDDTAEFTGTATTDSVNTTFDAPSGFSQTNRKTANLTATTNTTRDRFYRTANSTGQVELVQVDSISSGASVGLRHDLAYDYTSGDSFQGLRQVITLDSTFLTTEANINAPSDPWKIEWVYTINSVARRHMTFFDLVRVARQHNVQEEDLYKYWPDLVHDQPSDQKGLGYGPQIDAAFDLVVQYLRDYHITADRVRDAERLDDLVVHAALMLIAESGESPRGRDIQIWVEERQSKFKERLENVRNDLLRDTGTEGAITVGAESPFFWSR